MKRGAFYHTKNWRPKVAQNVFSMSFAKKTSDIIQSVTGQTEIFPPAMGLSDVFRIFHSPSGKTMDLARKNIFQLITVRRNSTLNDKRIAVSPKQQLFFLVVFYRHLVFQFARARIVVVPGFVTAALQYAR